MKWIKVNVNDVLFSPLTMTEKGMVLSIQALTAHLQREPLEEEILQLSGMGRKAFAMLSERLRSLNGIVSEHVQNTLSNVESYNSKKRGDAERQAKSRSKRLNVTRDISVSHDDVTELSPVSHTEITPLDKTRLDKRRIKKKQLKLPKEKKSDIVVVPDPPVGGAAAASLVDKKIRGKIPVEVDETIQKLLTLGIRKAKDKNAMTATLRQVYLDDPDEFNSWKGEIIEFQRSSADRQRRKAEQAEKQRRELEEKALILANSDEIKRIFSEIESLNPREARQVWCYAEEEFILDPENKNIFRNGERIPKQILLPYAIKIYKEWPK